MTKSSEAEQARRVNMTLNLLKRPSSSAEVLARLSVLYGLSRRQAYRYLRQARQAPGLQPIPEAKSVFTVKLPRPLIAEVRRQARREGSSISSWVDQALRHWLTQRKSHG